MAGKKSHHNGRVLQSTGCEGYSFRQFECVDKAITPSSTGYRETSVIHTENDCAGGLPCPPYESDKELNCVVCTK